MNFISGIEPFSLLDYPEKASCIIFFAGCPFRCGFCHNPEFVLPELISKIKNSFIKQEAVFNFLKKRQGLLDGVVISGGEPTSVPHLDEFLSRIKDLGFLIKLDTNGANPLILEKLVEKNLVDYFAMDIKINFDNYHRIIRVDFDINKIKQSFNFIKNCGLPYEFRTTVIKEIHTKKILTLLARDLQGVDNYFLQRFRSIHTLDKNFKKFSSYSLSELSDIAENIFKRYNINVKIR